MSNSRQTFSLRWIVLTALFIVHCSLFISPAVAQVGDHRNDMAIGFNGGMVLSNVGFLPKVPQTMHKGLTGGFTFRYTAAFLRQHFTVVFWTSL